MINGREIHFSYEPGNNNTTALEDISLHIDKGKFVALLGPNGCGKSTLVKQFNALLPLQEGELIVNNMSVREEELVWKLRRCCGMVFQNPDNQFISSVVDEDIAFGLENYEAPKNEIPSKVEEALSLVGMKGYEKRSTGMLSGGQKQRVALAGVLALSPEVLIFDEATAMLDPGSRSEVLHIIHKIHKEQQKTIIMITHYMEEAVAADLIYLIKDGKIEAHGTPDEILTDIKLMEGVGLSVPVPVKIYYDLKAAGIDLSRCPLTNEELVEEVCGL